MTFDLETFLILVLFGGFLLAAVVLLLRKGKDQR